MAIHPYEGADTGCCCVDCCAKRIEDEELIQKSKKKLDLKFDFNKCRDLEHPLCKEIIEACGLSSECIHIRSVEITFEIGSLATATFTFYTSGVLRDKRTFVIQAVEIDSDE